RDPWPSPIDTHGSLRYSSKAKAGIVPPLEGQTSGCFPFASTASTAAFAIHEPGSVFAGPYGPCTSIRKSSYPRFFRWARSLRSVPSTVMSLTNRMSIFAYASCGSSVRRREHIVPDSIDGRTLVLVDQGVERLQQPPDRGADPDCVRAVDFAVHRTAGLRVAAGPDREIQAPFHAQVDRGHAAQVL